VLGNHMNPDTRDTCTIIYYTSYL